MSSIENIKDVELPIPKDLGDSTDEETVYGETLEESQSDHKSREEFRLLQEKAREAINKLRIENENLKNLADHRIQYSKWIFWLVAVVISTVFTILILGGLEVVKIDKETLTALLRTNTMQVVGVLFIVAKWLYPHK